MSQIEKLILKSDFDVIKSNKLIKFKSITHGFFNKKGGISKGIYKSLNCGPGSNDKVKNINKNLALVSHKIGCKKKNLVLLNQIHSSKFHVINNFPKKKLIGDGAITTKKNIALCILAADCAPVFIFDPINKIIAAAHVGWKGAYKKILKKILKRLVKFGSKKYNLVAAIGPCIAQGNYEVKSTFKKKFLNQNNKHMKYFKIQRKIIYFNLGDFIKGQLVDFGVKNIEVIKKDTYNKKNNFFSSRSSLKNQENDYGRNISVIMIK